MIIHPPELTRNAAGVKVSARIEFARRTTEFPEALWFSVATPHHLLVNQRSDSFVVAMLLLAMMYGENIEVRGTLSPRLLVGIAEYQRAFAMWFPQKFKQITIHCNDLSPAPPTLTEEQTLCAFSGGVDSYFSLLRYLHAPVTGQPPAISALFVHGFDLRLEDEHIYTLFRKRYTETLSHLGVPLIAATTNFQGFGTRPNWGIFHGTVMIGLALLFSNAFSRFLVPASHTYTDLTPWGTDPRIDHLLSHEQMLIGHDGAGYTRVEKTDFIKEYKETHDTLRVCVSGPEQMNCCTCEKCLRTMVALDMFGVLAHFPSFPAPLRMRLLRSCRYYNASDFAFARELRNYARKVRRYDVWLNVSWAWYRSHFLNRLSALRATMRRKIKQLSLVFRS